ncbi:MAG: hypothetical protein Tsb0013_13650 [Phycisphaerales bacterium]
MLRPSVLALTLACSASYGADKIVESVPGSTFQYGPAPTVELVTFTTSEPITGVGLTGAWSSISGDLGGGTYPWAIDLECVVTAPGGEQGLWAAPFTGDVTIADFPINDGSDAILSGKAGPGVYQFAWLDALGQPNSLAQVADPVYHATTTVPDVMFSYTAQPDPSTSWDRPFFIEGVSGLGPTSYDVFEFTVDTPGRYVLTSVLEVDDNHFTFLYKGSFDDTQPLVNLLDYGLGNGFSVFGEPRGTSRIDTLLFPGETYYWVTSTWASFSPVTETSANTIVGPGNVFSDRLSCLEDFDNDGDVDLGDFGFFGAAFGSSAGDPTYDARADFDNDGDVDLGDFGAFGAAFGTTDCFNAP